MTLYKAEMYLDVPYRDERVKRARSAMPDWKFHPSIMGTVVRFEIPGDQQVGNAKILAAFYAAAHAAHRLLWESDLPAPLEMVLTDDSVSTIAM